LPIPWNTDDPSDTRQILDNARHVMTQAAAHARERNTPTVALARQWHLAFFDKCSLPVPYYAGEIRDSDPRYPELIDYEVRVGTHDAVPARDVVDELDVFEEHMQIAVGAIDSQLPAGVTPHIPGMLGSVLTLAASAHGEWVRIHPFANGNGRIGRVWGNWVLIRYGLPAVLRLRPRPAGDPYAQAALHSMSGDHQPMIGVLNTMIQRRIGK